jgi:hypothetical protein
MSQVGLGQQQSFSASFPMNIESAFVSSRFHFDISAQRDARLYADPLKSAFSQRGLTRP